MPGSSYSCDRNGILIRSYMRVTDCGAKIILVSAPFHLSLSRTGGHTSECCMYERIPRRLY